MWSERLSVEELNGKVLTKIEDNFEQILFHTSDGDIYKMFHEQDCCESVQVEEIIGDLEDLIGSPITMAEKITQSGESEWDTRTWTFYKFATIKGYVTIRWLGESNGYYSESVDFIKLSNEEEI